MNSPKLSRNVALGRGYPDDEAMREAIVNDLTKALETWQVDTSDLRAQLEKLARTVAFEPEEETEDVPQPAVKAG